MKQKRKLSSFTLSNDAIEKLSLISNQEGVTKSRVIESLINNYKSEKNVMHIANAAGPIELPLDEIALRVSKIIKNNE